MGETTIGGYELLGKLGVSKRFRAFRASVRTPKGVRRGILYLMTDRVRERDLFIETVEAIREAWPFPVESSRDFVLPKAQLWKGRPWLFLPDLLPVATSVRNLGRAAFESLRDQLRWLEQFQPPGGERRFAHGDVRKERIALFDEEQPLFIAPGWIAASDYARGRGLSHARGDDAWHLGKLWILQSDHSFVPEGMEPEPSDAIPEPPTHEDRSALETAPAHPALPQPAVHPEPAPARAAPDPSAATQPPVEASADLHLDGLHLDGLPRVEPVGPDTSGAPRVRQQPAAFLTAPPARVPRSYRPALILAVVVLGLLVAALALGR